jgi:hypothetical protein
VNKAASVGGLFRCRMSYPASASRLDSAYPCAVAMSGLGEPGADARHVPEIVQDHAMGRRVLACFRAQRPSLILGVA